MTELLIFVPPVLSALLGAVAVKGVDSLSRKRSSISAIQHGLTSNYWRLEGEIQDIHRDDWSESYSRVVRLDMIEAVRTGSPGDYIEIFESVEDLTLALAELEFIQREQYESKRPDAYVADSEEEIVARLSEIQDLIVTAEENLDDYLTESLIRRVLFAGATKEFEKAD
ncbi:hypothetical protein [Haloarchaeobius sp. DFWS5]|uniref:hypothetical protein n=1 Tax=Haloarchaeobius sp. DFWS5 TaxID=3446114 RepID=UPI003EBFFA29